MSGSEPEQVLWVEFSAATGDSDVAKQSRFATAQGASGE